MRRNRRDVGQQSMSCYDGTLSDRQPRLADARTESREIRSAPLAVAGMRRASSSLALPPCTCLNAPARRTLATESTRSSRSGSGGRRSGDRQLATEARGRGQTLIEQVVSRHAVDLPPGKTRVYSGEFVTISPKHVMTCALPRLGSSDAPGTTTPGRSSRSSPRSAPARSTIRGSPSSRSIMTSRTTVRPT